MTPTRFDGRLNRSQSTYGYTAGWRKFVEERCVLPVGGGARVEDVLLGREQRQAVGVKVDLLLAHYGKSSRTTPAASVFTGPGGFRGRFVCWKSEYWWSAGKPARKVDRFMQRSSPEWRSVQALHPHGVEKTVTALWSFVQLGRVSFQWKAPPPVERVESIMTSLAGSLRGKVLTEQRTESVTCEIIQKS